MNLVVIPFHDWKKCEREGFRTRDAHFMQEFEKHPIIEKLLIINRPISVAEMVLMGRNWQPQTRTTIYQQGNIAVNQVSTKTFTLDIRIYEFIKPLRMKRHWTPYIFGQRKVVEAVKNALSVLGMNSNYNLFTSAPLYVPLIQQLSPKFLAFDAQDNLLKQDFYRDVPCLEEYYKYCLKHADFISANSQETTHWFQKQRSDALHLPNGVDEEVFNPDQAFPLPSDMSAIRSPIVGYAGKMQEMFDLSLMMSAVSSMPDVQFVFIGQQLNPGWMKPLWEFNNTHYLGDKPYHLLPNYLAAFDVCTIPYDLANQHGGDPIKFYEYMAMGKPIVTTNIGNVHSFQQYPQVCIADSPEEFVCGIRDFIQKLQKGSPVEKRPLPASALWSTKADRILNVMISDDS